VIKGERKKKDLDFELSCSKFREGRRSDFFFGLLFVFGFRGGRIASLSSSLSPIAAPEESI